VPLSEDRGPAAALQALLAAIIPTALAGGCVPPPPPPPGECSKDGDCRPTETCVEELCVRGPVDGGPGAEGEGGSGVTVAYLVESS